jgi:3-hydroxyacyl-CoA dehydrogenase
MQHNYVRDKVYASVPESARKLIKAEFIGSKESESVMFAYASNKMVRKKIAKLIEEKQKRIESLSCIRFAPDTVEEMESFLEQSV